MKSILVYCGANAGTNPIYTEKAIELGLEMVAQKIKLIYGGGSLGLMGVISTTIMENGGEVSGVIPYFLDKMEVGNPNITQVTKVDTMHQRKAIMEEQCDGVITLPGGYGSMDELFEILSWAQLGLHKKPVGILNVNGFYDNLIKQLDVMVAEGFLKIENRQLLLIDTEISDLLDKMNAFKPLVTQKWLDKSGI